MRSISTMALKAILIIVVLVVEQFAKIWMCLVDHESGCFELKLPNRYLINNDNEKQNLTDIKGLKDNLLSQAINN